MVSRGDSDSRRLLRDNHARSVLGEHLLAWDLANHDDQILSEYINSQTISEVKQWPDQT